MTPEQLRQINRNLKWATIFVVVGTVLNIIAIAIKVWK